MLEYQNIKTFFQKTMLQIGLKKFFLLLFRGHMLLVILMEKKLLEPFTKKELQKINQKRV